MENVMTSSHPKFTEDAIILLHIDVLIISIIYGAFFFIV